MNSHDGALHLLCWEGYEDPAFLEIFSNRENAAVSAETLVSDHGAATAVMANPGMYDAVNLNNPYARNVLYAGHHIRTLNSSRFESKIADQFSWLHELESWTRADDGNLIGISQRFGPFNMVVNTNRISSISASDLGFRIVEEVAGHRPYGILQFPEFNIFHICIAANINPFEELTMEQLDRFEQMAVKWFANAKLVTDDSNKLNHGLIDGTIDFFVSGGLFTSAAARLAGQSQIKCVTPDRGPIDGSGAIAFMEITSLPSSSNNQDIGIRYLDYLLESEAALQIAMNPAVCNPVTQMANPQLFSQLPKNYLDAIQWDTLEEDITRCAAYDIPPNYSDLSIRLEKAQRGTRDFPS